MKTYPENYYTKEDINKAFDMGLETTIDVFQKQYSTALLFPYRLLINKQIMKRYEEQFAPYIKSVFVPSGSTLYAATLSKLNPGNTPFINPPTYFL